MKPIRRQRPGPGQDVAGQAFGQRKAATLVTVVMVLTVRVVVVRVVLVIVLRHGVSQWDWFESCLANGFQRLRYEVAPENRSA